MPPDNPLHHLGITPIETTGSGADPDRPGVRHEIASWYDARNFEEEKAAARQTRWPVSETTLSPAAVGADGGRALIRRALCARA